jgi:hypothetical protein
MTRDLNAERQWKVEVIHDSRIHMDPESLKSLFLSRGGQKNRHSFQCAKSKLDIYLISRGDGTSPLEFPKYPGGVTLIQYRARTLQRRYLQCPA